MPEMFEAFVAICIGIGLAASCGFRVFVPLLVMSAASRADYLQLSEGFQWISTWPALIALAIATALEIGAYYVPWLDNLLDSISTPAAVIAGIISTAACVTDVDPMVKWSVAIIGGGGIAGIIKAGTAGARAASSLTTAGLGNPVISTAEWLGSMFLSLLALLLPFLAAAIALVLAAVLAKFAFHVIGRLAASGAGPPQAGEGEIEREG